jgi:macrolide-specific efflux system membrane fusion protein
MRRRIVVVPVVALVAAGIGVGGWTALADEEEPAADTEATEQLVEATVEDLSRTVDAEGTIEAETTEDLSFDVSGTVTEVLVAAGDEVTAGQALARIDSSELEAAVVAAEAAVDDAEAALAEAEDADASDTELEARQAQLDSANVDLVAAVEDLAGATLAAPVDGSVAAVGYEVGDVLGSDGTDGTDMTGSDTDSGQLPPTGDDSGETTEGIQVVSTGTYVVTIDVDATEVDLLAEGQTARVTPTTSSSSSGAGPGGLGPMVMGPMAAANGGVTDERADAMDAAGADDEAEAAGEEVEGTVTSVGAVASADSGVATFPVEITVEGSPDEFFPGALAEVAVVYEEIADAVTVPAMAVRQVDGQATVTVAEGDDREERAVTTGVTSGASIEIVEGLEPGEQVVVELPSFRDDDSDDGGPTGGPSGGPTGGPLVVQEGP